MLLTLDEARASALRKISSSCPQSQDFLSLLNEATRRLMRRGDWRNTVVPIYVCVRKGCVTFPRYVEEIRKANLCNNYVPVRNGWYTFLDFNAGRNWSACGWWGWLGQETRLTQTHDAPTFSDIAGEGRLVRVYPQANADIGKTVKLFGVDNNDQPLRTIDGTTGLWSEGITITMAAPFGSSSTFVRRIDRVLKQETTAPVTMYAYNSDADVLEELATYDPGETNPVFIRYNLSADCGYGTESGASCSEAKPLVALVKLRFVPVKTGTDLVLVDNLDALKEMIQSVKLGEAGNPEEAAKFEARALRELNMGLRNGGDDSIPVSVEPFNGVPCGMQRMI